MSGTPAVHFADRLASLGIGTRGSNSGWSISVGREPIAPATTITIYDTGGGEVDTDDQNMTSPAIQVRVRAETYEACYGKQEAIRQALILGGFAAGGARYYSVAAISGILSVGRDDADRYLMTQNFQALCEGS